MPVLSLPRVAVGRYRRWRLDGRARLGRSSPRVRRVILMLQNGCALRCRMCDLWLEEPVRFPAERAVSLLESACLAPAADLHLTGGEPFLYPGFAELYADLRGRAKGLMTISSSGEPADAVLSFLKKGTDLRRTTLVFSWDGAGAHDGQRGKPGAEASLLNLVEEIRRLRPDATLAFNCTLTPWNAGSARATFERARALGIPVQFQLVHSLPEYTNAVRPDRLEKDFRFTAETLSRLKEDLAWIFNRLSLRTDRREMGHLLGLIESLDGEPPRAGACAVPSQSVFIRADGAVLTCRGCAPVGDALKDGLDAAWNGPAAGELRENGCGNCERRYAEF